VASCCESGNKFYSIASHRVFTIKFGEYKPASTRALCPGNPLLPCIILLLRQFPALQGPF